MVALGRGQLPEIVKVVDTNGTLRYAIRRRDGRIRHVHEHGRGVCGEDGPEESVSANVLMAK